MLYPFNYEGLLRRLVVSRLAYSNIPSLRCQSKSVDDNLRAAFAVFVDPLGVTQLQPNAPVGKVLP